MNFGVYWDWIISILICVLLVYQSFKNVDPEKPNYTGYLFIVILIWNLYGIAAYTYQREKVVEYIGDRNTNYYVREQIATEEIREILVNCLINQDRSIGMFQKGDIFKGASLVGLRNISLGEYSLYFNHTVYKNKAIIVYFDDDGWGKQTYGYSSCVLTNEEIKTLSSS